MIVWGPEVTGILDMGSFLANTVKNPENMGFRLVVLAGAAKTGTTSLAAQICKSFSIRQSLLATRHSRILEICKV